MREMKKNLEPEDENKETLRQRLLLNTSKS